MGNEMGNQNVTGIQEQDSTKLDASKESVEVSAASSNADGIEDANQQISSGDSSETGDPTQTINGGEQQKTDTQGPVGSLKALIGLENHTGIDDRMQSVSSIDGGDFHQQIDSPSKENFPSTRDNQIQKHASSGKEEGEARTLSLDTDLETRNFNQNESNIVHTKFSVSATESQKTNDSPSEEKWRKDENHTKDQASLGGEGEEMRNALLDPKSFVPNPQFLESGTVPDQHKSTTSHADSSEIVGVNGHTGSASEDNASRTNKNEVQRHASIVGECEEERTSSLDNESGGEPKSRVLETRKSDPHESTEAHTKLFMEAGSKFPGSSWDTIGSTSPQDAEEKGLELEDESNLPHSYTRTEKMEENMPKDDMESQDKEKVDIININGVMSETINAIKVGKTIDGTEAEIGGSEEPELPLSNSPWNDSRDSGVSQFDIVALTKSPYSCQIEVPAPEYVVPTTNGTMVENVSEGKQKRYDSNTTSLSEGMMEEPNANEMNICQSEFVRIGSAHKKERVENEPCGSCKPMTHSSLQIDNENVPLFKLKMQDGNQKLVSGISCKELEEETKMVVVDIVLSLLTESVLNDSNHEEGKLSTCLPLPAEKFLQSDPVPLDKSQVPKQDRVIETDTVDSRSGSTIESDQNSSDEVDVSSTSNFDFTNSSVESKVSLENVMSWKDLSQHQGLDKSSNQEFGAVALTPSGMSTDGAQSTCNLTNHMYDHEPNFNIVTEENNNSVNEMNQDNNKGKVDIREKFSLEFYFPRQESEALETQSENRFCAKDQVLAFTNFVPDTKETGFIPEVEVYTEVNKLPDLDSKFSSNSRFEISNETPLPSPGKTAKGEEFNTLEIQLGEQLHAKDKVPVLLSCGSETLSNTKRLTDDLNPEDVNFHIEVSKPPSFDFELPLEERLDESDQSPLLRQERATKDDVSQLQSYGSETLANAVDDDIENAEARTEPPALTGGKEKSGRDQLPYEEMSAEKHVIALGRASTENLVPLLGFFKEGEKNEKETEKKNKHHEAKNPAKNTATSAKVTDKRKPKYSLFCNCIGRS